MPANIGTVRIESQTETDVILRMTPSTGTPTVDIGSLVAFPDGTVRIPMEPGVSKNITVNWRLSGTEELERYSVYFEFAHPDDSSDGVVYNKGRLQPLVDAALGDSSLSIRVDAYSSRQSGTAQAAFNQALSVRRANYLKNLLVERGIPENQIDVHSWGNQLYPGHDGGTDNRLITGQVPNDNSAENEWAGGNNPNYNQSEFQVAVASLLRTVNTDDQFTGRLYRPSPTAEPRIPDQPVPQGQQPDFIQHIGGSVRFERDPVPVAYELRLMVDFQTAHERGLEKLRADYNEPPPPSLPQNPNPASGVVEFRLALTYDPGTGTFQETLVAHAVGDSDGLWSWGEIPTANTEPSHDMWRDILGLYFTLAPLLAGSAADVAAGGEIVPLVVGLATPLSIATLGVAHVLRFTHYGVELDVRHNADEVHASLLFDVESAILLNLKLGRFVIAQNHPDKPIKVRYKAIGFALDAPHDKPVRFSPVFDSSRGYTLDLTDSGSLEVLPSLGLGNLIQVLGARIARTNPLNIEVELGMGVDLGVVSVDRFGFRLPVHPSGPPSITALSVGVDIPEVLTGKGYLKINKDGFAGQLDVSLVSVKLRIAGGLSIESIPDCNCSAKATIVTLAVELPGGIPLGGTGLAIFGILGLFAMHKKRNEDSSAKNPALKWFKDVGGDPTNLQGWVSELDRWAFGVGLVAGTIEGGTVLNLKGMLVLELPGPRVVLFVKASILSPKPNTKGSETGSLFAVVDISPQRVLIGLQFAYEIKEILEIRIPVEAGFFSEPPEHFYVDVGSIAQPITAKLFGVIDATAYFMVHGDGISEFPLGNLAGFSIATGFRASFTWGNTEIGLYLKIASGFDLGIGFKPLFFAGQVFIEGELRLFIISIAVSATLSFRAGENDSGGSDALIDGNVEGEIRFLFFTIKGSIHFSIGKSPNAPTLPDPVRDLILQSRSPALIEGTGVDRGIDNILCRGTTDGSVPTVEIRQGDEIHQQEVFVPIDSIPLIQFEVSPSLGENVVIDGQLSSGLPPGFLGGWQKRGQTYLRYTIDSIELQLRKVNGVDVPEGSSPVTEGLRPYTWRHPGQTAGSDGLPVELALLDWKPTNMDKALIQGESLDGLVDSRWKHICTPVAEAAQVLWTFRETLLGTSPNGWYLDGNVWPDTPDSQRSLPVSTLLQVRDIWRTGTFLDGLLPAGDAAVAGIEALCPLPSTSPCIAKVLQAPYELLAESFALPDDPLGVALQKLEESRKTDLRDVIRITGGPWQEVKLLIFARSKMTDTGLIQVRGWSSEFIEMPNVAVTFTKITADEKLPSRWVEHSGSWQGDVQLARSYFSVLETQHGNWSQYLVQIKLLEPALILDIGVSPLAYAIHQFAMEAPAFFVAVIEGLSQQEVLREQADRERAEADRLGLENALGNQHHALLLPNAEYQVTVKYSGEIGQNESNVEQPKIKSESQDTGTVSRTFFTDPEPPRNLEPWMLVQFPEPGELYHFYQDEVVVVFATDDVLELYHAYGRQLRAVARAASFRGSANTQDAQKTHLLLTSFFEQIEGALLSPWEATVRYRLGQQTCLNYNPAAPRHGRAALPFAMDPLTDYVLDIEMLDLEGQPAFFAPLYPDNDIGMRPLFRQHFSTSRYPDREAFAEAVRLSLVGGRPVKSDDFRDSLLRLTERVTDEAFDTALLQAGFEVSARPKSPHVTVLWDTGIPPQPLAVFIETPEPLWRTRREPKAEYDDSGKYIIRWILSDQMWLKVDEMVRVDGLVAEGGDFVMRANGLNTTHAVTLAQFRDQHLGPRSPILPAQPPLPAAFVERFVYDASGTRTLAILKPGCRGRTVSLGLLRNLHPLLDIDSTDTPVVLCEVDLSLAPWEEPV